MHTPGPWVVGTNGLKDCCGTLHREAWIEKPKDKDWGQAASDAQLIAAAPELLEALAELLSAREYVLRKGGDILTSCSWAKAEVAIAHATCRR